MTHLLKTLKYVTSRLNQLEQERLDLEKLLACLVTDETAPIVRMWLMDKKE